MTLSHNTIVAGDTNQICTPDESNEVLVLPDSEPDEDLDAIFGAEDAADVAETAQVAEVEEAMAVDAAADAQAQVDKKRADEANAPSDQAVLAFKKAQRPQPTNTVGEGIRHAYTPMAVAPDIDDPTDWQRRVAEASLQRHPLTVDVISPWDVMKRLAKRKNSDGEETDEPQMSHDNLMRIFACDPRLRGLSYDLLSARVVWSEGLPTWRNPLMVNTELIDEDVVKINSIVDEYYGGGYKIPRTRTWDSIFEYTMTPERTYHPIVAYIEALPKWDGEHRLETSISTVEESEYSRTVLVNFWLSMMLRIFEPGAQVDSMLVLYGRQGGRKTSFFRGIFKGVPGLMSPLYEMPGIPDGDKGKDWLIGAHQSALALFDEIDQFFGKRDQKAMKGLVTTLADSIRPPYGRVNQTRQRGFVLVGTTNDDQLLTDNTGGRRYWPLRIDGEIPDEDRSRDKMDLLLAEARDRFRAGERHKYGREFEALADKVRAEVTYDPVAEVIDQWLAGDHRSCVDKERVDSNGNPCGPGVIIPVERVTAALLTKHVEDLSPQKLGMSRKDLSGRIKTYLDGRDDYEKKSSARGVYGSNDRPSKDVYVLVGDEEGTAGTGAPVSPGAVQAPPQTYGPTLAPWPGMKYDTGWDARDAELRQWVEEWYRTKAKMRDGWHLALDQLEEWVDEDRDDLMGDLPHVSACAYLRDLVDVHQDLMRQLLPTPEREPYAMLLDDLVDAAGDALDRLSR